MRLRERLWNPYIVVFLSSGSVMILELVASRMMAPRLGVSLYTWTSVIGVILAGGSLGNYIGGRLADRFASRPFLGVIFGIASLASLSTLWLNNDLHNVIVPENLPLMVWVVGYIAAVFFLPSMILGCVSPLVVKLSLTDLKRSGATVGKIYAWSAVGSIVGTFGAGFYLISLFGTKTIVLMVAGLLMLMALWFLTDIKGWKGTVSAVVALVLAGGSVGMLYRGQYLKPECLCETNYFCINVYDKDLSDGRTVRELVLDRLVHSYSDLQDPTRLVYGYEQTYAQVVKPMMDAKPNLDAMFIGGGGYTFPRYMEAKLPESHIVVAEIDPGVTQVAYDYLGLQRGTKIDSRNLDARILLQWQSQPASYDLVFGDAFNDYSVPYHLTTLEFDRLVKGLLREDGLYVVNIIDGGKRGHFLRAYVRTLQQVFPNVLVIPSDLGWKGAARTTFVIVASRHSITYQPDADQDQPLTEQTLNEYLNLEPPLILTDDYVPVDNLLAPVFEDSQHS